MSAVSYSEIARSAAPGHTVGSNKIYQKGFLDYQEDIRRAMDAPRFCAR